MAINGLKTLLSFIILFGEAIKLTEYIYSIYSETKNMIEEAYYKSGDAKSRLPCVAPTCLPHTVWGP